MSGDIPAPGAVGDGGNAERNDRMRLAKALIDEGRNSEAVATLDPWVTNHALDSPASYLLGLAAYRANNNRLAEQAFRGGIVAQPDDAKMHYGLGITLLRTGASTEAARCFERAVGLDPSLTRARQRLEETRHQGDREALANRLDSGERNADSSAGRLLRSGHRRVSSYGGHFILALVLVLGGGWLILTDDAGRARSIASWWPLGTDIDSLTRLVELTPPGTRLNQLQRELDIAMAQVDARTSMLDWLLPALGIALLAAGILLGLRPLVASRMELYEVYERRIDVARGILSRRHASVWLFEITEVVLREPWRLTATGNAEVRIMLDDGSPVKITGFGTVREQHLLWRELRDAALAERRAMKHWWV